MTDRTKSRNNHVKNKVLKQYIKTEAYKTSRHGTNNVKAFSPIKEMESNDFNFR